jgi:hypothetical protein
MIDIEDNKDRLVLEEEELNILYFYLDLELETMDDEEKAMWYDILQKIDPDEEI